MHWSYDDLMALPLEVYGVLIEKLSEEMKERAARMGH